MPARTIRASCSMIVCICCMDYPWAHRPGLHTGQDGVLADDPVEDSDQLRPLNHNPR